MRKYLRENAIEHGKSPALWPQANGKVEQKNHKIILKLKNSQIYCKNQNILLKYPGEGGRMKTDAGSKLCLASGYYQQPLPWI